MVRPDSGGGLSTQTAVGSPVTTPRSNGFVRANRASTRGESPPESCVVAVDLGAASRAEGPAA